MHKLAIPFVLALTPVVLAAQASGQAQASAKASTNAQVSANAGGVSMSTSTSASADAEIALARKRGLPTKALENRVAEGRAKGASNAELASSAAKGRANLETADEVLVSSGRRQPSNDEVERGAEVLAGGYSRAQLEAVVKAAPSDRSLVVAFDVLSRLRARGVASAQALEQVRSKLEARAVDADLETLVSANANGNAGLGGAHAAGSAAVGATGKAGAAAGGVTGAAGAAAGVTGTVKGVIKP